jgi:hypothetical protein
LSGGELLRLALGGFDLIVGSTEKRRSWPVGESVFRSFAGACWSCGGLADWLSGLGECCSRHTFARSFKASSSGFPQVRISTTKFACSFTHFATAASASCNQDGEVLLSSDGFAKRSLNSGSSARRLKR